MTGKETGEYFRFLGFGEWSKERDDPELVTVQRLQWTPLPRVISANVCWRRACMPCRKSNA